jgi:hypothetical protein
MKQQPLAQIQVTISEEGLIGVEVQADNPEQTRNAYKLLTHIAEDLAVLDRGISQKDLRRRLAEDLPREQQKMRLGELLTAANLILATQEIAAQK